MDNLMDLTRQLDDESPLHVTLLDKLNESIKEGKISIQVYICLILLEKKRQHF